MTRTDSPGASEPTAQRAVAATQSPRAADTERSASAEGRSACTVTPVAVAGPRFVAVSEYVISLPARGALGSGAHRQRQVGRRAGAGAGAGRRRPERAEAAAEAAGGGVAVVNVQAASAPSATPSAAATDASSRAVYVVEAARLAAGVSVAVLVAAS